LSDPFTIDVNPPSPSLAAALDKLADATAALHAQTRRLENANRRLQEYLECLNTKMLGTAVK
jgi:hypothetical protein